MAKPDQAFEVLYGHAPTDADRLRLMRIKDALGLRDDDDLWAVFVALGHFQALYEEVPEKIRKAAQDACENVRAAAEAKTIERLSDSIVEQVNAVAGRRAWRDLAIAGAVAVTVFSTMLAGLWWHLQGNYDQRIAWETERLNKLYQQQFADDADLLKELRIHFKPVDLRNANTVERMKWAKALTPDQLIRARSVTSLPDTQWSGLQGIMREAGEWDRFRADNKAPWPCIRWHTMTNYTFNGHSAAICEVGLYNTR